jgi:hypothetical protein
MQMRQSQLMYLSATQGLLLLYVSRQGQTCGCNSKLCAACACGMPGSKLASGISRMQHFKQLVPQPLTHTQPLITPADRFTIHVGNWCKHCPGGLLTKVLTENMVAFACMLVSQYMYELSPLPLT